MHHYATARRWTGSLLPFGNRISASKQTECLYKVMNGVTNVTLARLKLNTLRHSCHSAVSAGWGGATFRSRTQPKDWITEMKLVPPAAAPRLQPRGPSRTCVSPSVVTETKISTNLEQKTLSLGLKWFFFVCLSNQRTLRSPLREDHCRRSLQVWVTDNMDDNALFALALY